MKKKSVPPTVPVHHLVHPRYAVPIHPRNQQTTMNQKQQDIKKYQRWIDTLTEISGELPEGMIMIDIINSLMHTYKCKIIHLKRLILEEQRKNNQDN
jgi:hypothetical protein